MKNGTREIIEIAIAVIDWSAFLILAIVGLSTINGIWDVYGSKKTSMTMERQPITEHPTITMCFGPSSVIPSLWHPYSQLILGIDFNITYSNGKRLMIFKLSSKEDSNIFPK